MHQPFTLDPTHTHTTCCCSCRYDPFSGVESVSYHIDEEKFAALYNAAAVCTHVAAFYENQNGAMLARNSSQKNWKTRVGVTCTLLAASS